MLQNVRNTAHCYLTQNFKNRINTNNQSSKGLKEK